MDRYDVVVMGLDPMLPRDAVVAAVAKHVAKSPAQIEQLLGRAPAAIVEDVTELDARRLVTDLRQLGARVKPRAAGQPLSSRPPSPSDPARAPSVPPLGADRPRASARPGRSPLEEIDFASLPPSDGSGLELDLPLPEPRTPSVPPRAQLGSPLDLEALPVPRARTEPQRTRAQPEPAPAKLIEVAETPERPRAFWTALPEAFLVPFRGHALYGLLGAPLLAVAAMVCGVVGTRISLLAALAALVLAFGFVGAMLQVSRRCLWATAVGERSPDPLPSDIMSDYMFTGAGVVIAQGVFGGLSAWLGRELMNHGAPSALVDGFWVFIGLYGVIGFALSAANGSASGYLDVARILRILAKAPLHVLTIALLGALVQGGALIAAGLQLEAAVATGEFGRIFVSLGLVGFLVSFAATYGAALTATMMGMLFYAKPEVAS